MGLFIRRNAGYACMPLACMPERGRTDRRREALGPGEPKKNRRKKRQPAMVKAIHFGEGRKERMKTEEEKKKGTKEKAIPN